MTRLTKNLPIWKLTSVQKSIVANWKERIIRFAIFFSPARQFYRKRFFQRVFEFEVQKMKSNTVQTVHLTLWTDFSWGVKGVEK